MAKLDYTRHYTKWHSDDIEYRRAVVEANKVKLLPFLKGVDKDISILEIGCGMGFCLIALHEMGYNNVEGIDIDEGQVKSCLEKRLNVKLVKDTGDFLRESLQTFNLVILFDVLEHIPPSEQISLLRSIYNSLSIDGMLLCSVPNANSIVASTWRYIDYTHHSSFTEHSLDFVLYNSNFSNIVIKEVEFFRKPFFINFYSLRSYRRVLNKSFWKVHLHWWIFRFFRFIRRLHFIAELGWDQGKRVPLSLNLLAIAKKG